MKLFKGIKDILTNPKVLFYAFLVMLVLPCVAMFFTEPTSLLTRVIQILLPLSIYWILMTLSPKPGKMFWWLFLFMFIDAFQVVLLFLFGESPIAVDMFLNVVTTNITEVDELLGSLIPAVSTVFIIYGGGIVVSILALRDGRELSREFLKKQRRNGVLLLVPSVVLLGVNYCVDKRFAIEDDVFPVNGCYNLVLSVERFIDGRAYDATSRHFTYNASSQRADSIPEVYVMIIDETVRADNMGIYGYERNTTPRLSAMGGQLAVYRDALTMSNTTHKSVPTLLTAVASEQWDSLYTQKGIFTVFNEAGYKTSFYSNQRRNHSFIDHLGGEAQETVFAMDKVRLGGVQTDDVLLDLLTRRLSQYAGEKLFVVLHCYGSHFRYDDRYPKGSGTFKPDVIHSAKRENRPNLINAYDNTIVYTDNFLWRVTELLDSLHVPAALFYTSDHGEDIYDDSRNRFLHASPIPTYYQIRVPLLLWGSQVYIEQYPEVWAQVRNHTDKPVNTNMVAFHTMLDLAGINAKLFKPSLSLGNSSFAPVQRLYINDHNEYRTLDNAGLKQMDVDMFKKNGIAYP